MAGIYIHIPFCKSRCVYCNFYSTTCQDKLKDRYISALCKELTERKEYLKDEPIKTIYIGGGTPSQLTIEQLQTLFKHIENTFNLSQCEEVTLEANPDDLSFDYLKSLRQLPINRLSMGIQTFDDKTLKFLNRRHDSRQAINAVSLCREAGFSNFSIDLIYGLPGETDQRWQNDIKQALELRPPHISAYCLSYEDGTPLSKMLKEHRISETDEQSSLSFYRYLMQELKKAGYDHYEISNFCLPGKQSKHNSSYWHGIPYLGCGAAAHSYNKKGREWNVNDLSLYIIGMENGKRNYETEILDNTTQYNELVMTSLRTSTGIDLCTLKELFGENAYHYCLQMAKAHLESGKLERSGHFLRLSPDGIFVSDDIISDLFMVSL